MGADCSHEIKRHLHLKRKAMKNLVSVLQSRDRDITLLTNIHIVKAMVFPVVMYRCDSWTIKKARPKNWYFWTVVLEKSLENPSDCKDMKPAHPEGNQSWIFIGRTDAEAEPPILWSPDANSWPIGKQPNAEEDWRQKEMGMADDEMIRYHHQLNGHEF